MGVHRNAKPIRDCYTAWRNACLKGGLGTKAQRIPHDFRRTAVRTLVNAGVPGKVAMQMTGHRTRSVFDRYHIVSPGDMERAAALLDQQLTAERAALASGHNPGTVAIAVPR